ncbi:hypothetical protein DL95DRAFT_404779 [Leptodontidium sp. 2 PMI_412]|nr:hypothetical protein DL95DRAFT_404779 [Leptodontidium sp. 2 PMI_412]
MPTLFLPKITKAFWFFLAGLALALADVGAAVWNEKLKPKHSQWHYVPFWFSVFGPQECQLFPSPNWVKLLWFSLASTGTVISGIDFGRLKMKKAEIPVATGLGLGFSLAALLFDMAYIGYLIQMIKHVRNRDASRRRDRDSERNNNRAEQRFGQASGSNPNPGQDPFVRAGFPSDV